MMQAGGHFTEMYYWDSYWIIRGLLVNGMTTTARGMIYNMFHLVDTVGYIPNGNRNFYIRRSQPALLSKMVEEYYKFTGDTEFLRLSLPVSVRFVRGNISTLIAGWVLRIFNLV